VQGLGWTDEIVAKSRDSASADYQDRISELEKRLKAAVEEHRRMRRELEALERRDTRDLPRTRYTLPYVDDDARN
jgi:hypothetical protein